MRKEFDWEKFNSGEIVVSCENDRSIGSFLLIAKGRAHFNEADICFLAQYNSENAYTAKVEYTPFYAKLKVELLDSQDAAKNQTVAFSDFFPELPFICIHTGIEPFKEFSITGNYNENYYFNSVGSLIVKKSGKDDEPCNIYYSSILENPSIIVPPYPLFQDYEKSHMKDYLRVGLQYATKTKHYRCAPYEAYAKTVISREALAPGKDASALEPGTYLVVGDIFESLPVGQTVCFSNIIPYNYDT